jgi:hypothetical protein
MMASPLGIDRGSPRITSSLPAGPSIKRFWITEEFNG